MTDHVKIGSAILNREYFWSVECEKCTDKPEVYFRRDENSERRPIAPRKAAEETGSHVFDLSSPGLYCLKNFCGGGFRFDAKVHVTEHTIDILHLQGVGET